MRMLFFMGHPAHYHLFKYVIRRFLDDGARVTVVIVKKDVLENLVANENWDVVNLAPEGRRMEGVPFLLAAPILQWRTSSRLFKLVRQIRPEVMVGTERTLAHLDALLGIPSVLFNEDDTQATPENMLFYPAASYLALPECCDVGRWQRRRVSYPSYHELAYLHPDLFTPNPEVVQNLAPKNTPYFLVRLVSLTASHDVGKRGIDNALAERLLAFLATRGRVHITAERPLPSQFEHYRINLDPALMHHALAGASLIVGDSQTMAAEAMVLGTPSVRINDFVGKLSYLDEMENRYHLGVGLTPAQAGQLLETVDAFTKQSSLAMDMHARRQKLLSERLNPVPLFFRLITLAAEKKRVGELRRMVAEFSKAQDISCVQ